MKVIGIVAFAFLLLGCGDKNPKPPIKQPQKPALNFVVEQDFDGSDFDYNGTNFTNAAGNIMQFSNLKYLLSNFILIKTDGTEVKLDSSYAFVNLKTGRDSFSFPNLPAGNYSGMKFFIGLDSVVNHGDPNRYSTTHPLSPSVNQLHWGWSGGYIFISMEGLVQDSLGVPRGFSYHLANDENLRQVTCLSPFSVDSVSKKVVLRMNVAEMFKNPNLHDFRREPLTTHSSFDGGLSNRLMDNAKDVFSIKRIE
jgi:hypothetical protein